MKNTMQRSLLLLGVSLMMALSVAAQDVPKEKISDKEDKYKSEDLKTKDKKGKEDKYKSDDLKMKDKKDKKDKYKSEDAKIKDKKDETKVKSEALKIKDDKGERKIKGRVTPMQATKTNRTEVKTGETNVMVREHPDPITEQEPVASEPAVVEPVAVPQISAPVKKTYAHKYVKRKTTPVKYAASGANKTPRYIVRTKIVRDTVFVPSEPEKIVTTQTEYVHDTVSVTRVDTFVKMETQNTYTGYRVPAGNFKKVKLKPRFCIRDWHSDLMAA